jgi:hypothetical protein
MPGLPGQRDTLLRLQELDTKALTDVPCDMAMHEPCAWIVGRECYHDPTTTRQESDIATRWVLEVESSGICINIEDTCTSP